MPRPGLPPTPAPSTDIAGKHNAALPQVEPAFVLPPAAMAAGTQNSNARSRGSISPSTRSSNHSSDSSYRPMSPSSPHTLPRKRSSAALSSGSNAEDFALPPPPTRSRKIIQMKPRAQVEKPAKPVQQVFRATGQPESSGGPSTSNKTGAPQNAGGKKKQASGTTAAGRKTARKTAHSLIERRRRSKMNEEFGVLKDMIPACVGQEMHKLAILQASIEYLRYLEKCIADLQAANRSPHRGNQLNPTLPPHSCRPTSTKQEDGDEDEDEDEAMSDNPGSGASTPSAQPRTAVATPKIRPPANQFYAGPIRHSDTVALSTLPNISPILSNASSAHASPAIHPSHKQQAHHGSRHSSLSSYTTYASSGYLNSSLPSPAFDALANQRQFGSTGSLAEFRLASPVLKPQSDLAVQEKLNSVSSSASPTNTQLEGRSVSSNTRGPPTGVSSTDATARASTRAVFRAHDGAKGKGDGEGDTDMDQQATAALLALNAECRSWDAEENRGMSVRDLLRD